MRSLLRAGILSVTMAVSAAGQVDEKVKSLVHETLIDLSESKFAKTWESYSETSRDEYRKEFIAYFETLKATETPRVEEPKPKPKYSFETPDERQRHEFWARRPYWSGQLIGLGFNGSIDSLQAMTNKDFWQAFVAERYLSEKDPGFIPDNLKQMWGQNRGWRLPTYKIEGIAMNGNRFFVILKMELNSKQRLYAGIDILSHPPRPDKPVGGPEVTFTWSGSVANNRVKLDVPIELTEQLKRTSFALKERAAKN